MAQPKDFWITNAVFVTQDENRTVCGGALHIVDGVIADFAKALPAKIKKSRAKVIDAQGAFILPGFIQTHVHLCQTLFRNQADDLELLDWLIERIWPMEASHTRKTLRLSAQIGVRELLSSGTTCILDMGTVRHTDAICEVVEEMGIRASIGKCLMDRKETCPDELREDTQKALAEARALHKKWNGLAGDRIRISYAPRFAVSCTNELLKQVALTAHEQGALIHTHASENRGELELVKKLTGFDNIQYLQKMGLTNSDLVLAHCVWLTDDGKKILRDSGTAVAHCPTSNLKLASGIAPVPELRQMGITVSLGADGAPCNNNLNMFNEMRLAALIQKPILGPRTMKATEVLDMATREGARALRWDSDIGSIEIGKKADLIALNLDTDENAIVRDGKKLPTIEAIASSIVYSSNRDHVMWTMVDGQVVYQA